MNAPREDLIRSTPLAVTQTDFTRASDTAEDGDGRTMFGYPIVFEQPTEIKSKWEGHFIERIHPGALNRTLEQRGDQIQVMFNHGFDPQIADKPLGKPKVQEVRDYGLWTEVPLSRTSYNDDLIALMNDGALWGQSFRFSVLDERWNDHPEPSESNPAGIKERMVMELRLHEYGPVTYPAYLATTLGIRSVDAYSEWTRNRKDPLYAEVPVQEDTTTGPPIQAPGKRALVTAPRRSAAVLELARFLER